MDVLEQQACRATLEVAEQREQMGRPEDWEQQALQDKVVQQAQLVILETRVQPDQADLLDALEQQGRKVQRVTTVQQGRRVFPGIQVQPDCRGLQEALEPRAFLGIAVRQEQLVLQEVQVLREQVELLDVPGQPV